MVPEKYDEIKKTLDSLLYNVTYSQDLFRPSVAYTHLRTEDFCGTIYQIYVNNKDEELAQHLFLHEAGHICFGHTKNMNERLDTFLLLKIQSAYEKMCKYFGYFFSCQVDIKIFRNLLLNIVMDFEVNSRLFSKEEWDFQNARVSKLLNEPSTGMWPADYGYPMQLTWNEYLNLILLDPEKFFKALRKMLQEELRKNSSKNERSYDGFGLSPEENEKFRKIAEDHSSGTFTEIKKEDYFRYTVESEPTKQDFQSYKDMSDLLRKMEKVFKVNVRVSGRNDLLYNFNRRKYNTNIIIPKRTNIEVLVNRRLFILIDVSGSIESQLVYDFVKTFSSFNKTFKDTIFITWDTELVAEWKIFEPIPQYFGGGTDIAPGIKYVNSKYSPKSKDVLVVISDFQDYLPDWEKALAELNCLKVAVNWEPEQYHLINDEFNPGFSEIFFKTE